MNNEQLNNNIQNNTNQNVANPGVYNNMPSVNEFPTAGNNIEQNPVNVSVEQNPIPVNPTPAPEIKIEEPMPTPHQTTEVNPINSIGIDSIPTIEQSNQNFVANTQAMSTEKKDQGSKKVNYLLIIILLVAMFVAVFFVFPILKNYI